MITRCGVWVRAAVLAGPAAAAARADEHEHGHGQRREGNSQVVDGQPQVKTFNVGPTGSLKLTNVSGDVKLTTGGSEIRIESTIHGKGKTGAEARAEMDTVTVEPPKVSRLRTKPALRSWFAV